MIRKAPNPQYTKIIMVELKNSLASVGRKVADRKEKLPGSCDAKEIGVNVRFGVGVCFDVHGGGQEGGYEAGMSKSRNISDRKNCATQRNG
jgi:hypothetical protein